MDWTAIGAVWPILVGGIGTVVGVVIWAIRAESRSKTNEMIAKEARDLARSNAEALGAFRERVAQEYVTVAALSAIRIEITDALTRLGDRFDRMIERGRQQSSGG